MSDRAAEFWHRWAERGESLRSIGRDHGISGERVRQVMLARYGAGLVGLAKQRLSARRRLRRYVDGRVSVTCAVCGDPVGSRVAQPRWPLCVAHRPLRSQVMLMCDERYHAAHRAAVARLQGRQVPDEPSPRRSLRKGSRMHALCIEAYRNGWPLLERLPPGLRAWLAAEAEAEAAGVE